MARLLQSTDLRLRHQGDAPAGGVFAHTPPLRDVAKCEGVLMNASGIKLLQ